MKGKIIHSCPDLVDRINETGILPLLHMGIRGWSAQDLAGRECLYHKLPDGGWEWPLWDWKGPAIRESGCAYGKFFPDQSVFISREWWPDFCNYRRSVRPGPEEGSAEECILDILERNGSLTTKELRKACDFTEPGTRGKFSTLVNHLEMQCRVVTRDFVYSTNRKGQPYGWGTALLTTPEALFGSEACHPDRTPEQSRDRLVKLLRGILPDAWDGFFDYLLKGRNS